MTVTRRTLLQAGTLLPLPLLIGGCPREVPPCPDHPFWDTPDSALTIDIHAHVFNATDLQVKEFVARVGARQATGGLAKLARHFGSILQTVSWGTAPNARRELSMLDDLADGLEKNCPSLANTLEQQRADQYARGVAELKTTAARARAQRSIARLERSASWESASDEEKGVRAIEELPDTYDTFRARRAARSGPLELSAERVSLESVLAFVIEMFQYRYGSTFRLLQTYNTTQRKLDLLVAHLVDYDWWLAGGKSTLTSLPKQVEVMSRIAVLTSGRVHPFVPFCPLRETQYRLHPGSTDSSLRFVKQAVRKQGAIGVKLYPPMGFAPFGNATVEPQIWQSPDWLPSIARRRDFGQRLDAALQDFYTWCVAEEVPVMAHSNPSNGPAAAFEELAGPRYWKLALDAFPGLRISFGHFGSVVERGSAPNAAAFMALMLPTGSHAFADSGYFSEAIDRPEQLENALVALFQADAAGNKTLASRFMFGTDWKMLALESDAERYLSDMDGIIARVATRLGNLGDYSQLAGAFSGRNAAAFLGLRPGEKNRSRIDAFYRDNGIERTTWATKLGSG